MSTRYHTYLGPYFACKPTKVQVKVMGVAVCSGGCKGQEYRSVSAAFCSRCGSILVPADKFTEEDSPGWPDVDEALGGKMHILGANHGLEGGPHCWVSNRCDDGSPRTFMFWGDHGTAYLDLTGISREKEMAWLEGRFSEERKKLKEMYGNVATLWGFVRYAD